MNEFNLDDEIERLASLMIPYLCEHTGISQAQIKQLLDAQDEFWKTQPHVIGHMTIFGCAADELDEDDDDA